MQGASHVLAGGRSRNGRRYHINSAALGLVPYEDLRAEVYGAHRNLRNQAAATKGAKQ